MLLKVVTMAELRFDVLFEPERTGETVADVCRRYEISRDTYYRYRRRYLAEGIEGLEDRLENRRPLRTRSRRRWRSASWRCARRILGAELDASALNSSVRALRLQRSTGVAPSGSTVELAMPMAGTIASRGPLAVREAKLRSTWPPT